VTRLLALGEWVRVPDSSSTGRHQNPEAAVAAAPNLAQLEVIESDFHDLDWVQQAMAGVGPVVHLSAIASVQQSRDAPQAMDAVNITGTLHMPQAAREGCPAVVARFRLGQAPASRHRELRVGISLAGKIWDGIHALLFGWLSDRTNWHLGKWWVYRILGALLLSSASMLLWVPIARKSRAELRRKLEGN